MSVIFSIGKWGGVYVSKSKWSFRLCLGFAAMTIIYDDIDDVFEEYLYYQKTKQFMYHLNNAPPQ